MTDWSSLPLSHPVPFSQILLYLPPHQVLACRAVCISWSAWFSSSSSFWSRYLSNLLSKDQLNITGTAAYRRRKILEANRTDSEAVCLRLAILLSRAEAEVCPPVSSDTMRLVSALEESVPVLGPPAIFLKLKVDHPVVKKIIVEVLSNYLTCICLNKQDQNKNEIRNFVYKHTWGPNGTQNWAFVDNLRNKDQVEEEEEEKVEEESELEGVVLEGEHRLEEALRLSLQPRGEKRKAEVEEEEDQESHKKKKMEEEQEVEPESGEGMSIYSVEEDCKPRKFPTIMDVLSIDHEAVRSLLMEKCKIDKYFIVPDFDQFIQNISLFDTEDETIRIVGCDNDGKVVSINPAMFRNMGDTMVGFIDSPSTIQDHGRLLTVWGGRDIRDKWPEFAQQLLKNTEDQIKPPKKLKRFEATNNGQSSSSAPQTESDILASLASRGISILRK